MVVGVPKELAIDEGAKLSVVSVAVVVDDKPSVDCTIVVIDCKVVSSEITAGIVTCVVSVVEMNAVVIGVVVDVVVGEVVDDVVDVVVEVVVVVVEVVVVVVVVIICSHRSP